MANGNLKHYQQSKTNAPALQPLGKLAMKLLIAVFAIGSACLIAKILNLNMAPQKELLTTVADFNRRTAAQVAFWLSVFLGFFSAQAKPSTWLKKVLKVLGFFLTSMLSFMIIIMSVSDFVEYRAFDNGKSQIVTERFQVVDTVKKTRRRHVNYKAVLSSSAYKKQPDIKIDRLAYEYLLTRRHNAIDKNVAQTPDWQGSFTTDQCIDLLIEHNGAHARALLKGTLPKSDFDNC